MKNKIEAKIVADSLSPQGHRITTFLLTYPRFIHSELMTHRMFSRNSASSRAIPFEKMVKMVEEDPFIPIAWQKDHKGMQGVEYITDPVKIDDCVGTWLLARNKATREAKYLNNLHGVTKQLCNRLLEPFMWHTVLVTATEWKNFFELRCPKYELSYYPLDRPEALEPTEISFRSKKDYNNFILKLNWTSFQDEQEWYRINTSQAEIHIQALAEAMWDEYNQSKPKQLESGQWHIPFGDKMDITTKSKIVSLENNRIIKEYDNDFSITIPSIDLRDLIEPLKVKIATARCARLSYMTFDGEIDYQKDIELHDRLLASHHMSPFEHCAKVMTDKEYYSFVKGVIPTQIDEFGITNLEMMPFSSGHPIVGFTGLNATNGDKYGWCDNFKGFISYRYLIENN